MSARIRVLLVHQPVDGGVGRHVADLAAGLQECGYEVTLAGPHPPPGAPASCRHEPLELERQVKPVADASAVARLAAIAGALRPHIVHAHSSKAGAVARLAHLARPSLPVLYTPHGYAFNGYFERRSQRLAYREIERALAPLAARVVCVCAAEARLARALGRAARVRVIHNGIEPVQEGGRVDRRIAELGSGGPVICALTLLRPGKGLETLIDAMPALLSAHPGARLAIAGPGPEEAALADRARARGVAEAVRFLSPIDDPIAFLRGADVFVHPSWAESFPYAILEAMAVGLPIVACDVGGIGEGVIDGQSGLLVAPRDPAALAEALSSLLGDERLRRRLGEQAKQRLESRFTRAGMIERLDAVYRELLRA